MRKSEPFEQFRWASRTFKNPVTQPDFDNMVCSLANMFPSGVRMNIVDGPQGPIVVTWMVPANA